MLSLQKKLISSTSLQIITQLCLAFLTKIGWSGNRIKSNQPKKRSWKKKWRGLRSYRKSLAPQTLEKKISRHQWLIWKTFLSQIMTVYLRHLRDLTTVLADTRVKSKDQSFCQLNYLSNQTQGYSLLTRVKLLRQNSKTSLQAVEDQQRIVMKSKKPIAQQENSQMFIPPIKQNLLPMELQTQLMVCTNHSNLLVLTLQI